jgi:hypothetical protein
MKKIAIGIVIGIAIALVIGFVAPSIMPPTQTPETTETYIYIDGKIVVGGDGEPIELIDNPNANNPTYAELLAFLEADQTDRYSYIVGPPKVAYVCADFAKDVHNNAEAAGIRAAFVALHVAGTDEGHAINAFETTDRGLVFIDCTGKGLWDESLGHTRWDRRAYVEVGKPYTLAYVERAKTRFRFVIHMPFDADRKTVERDRLVTDEQVIRSLEESGWVRDFSDPILAGQAWEEKRTEMLVWSRANNIEELGATWMQEWIWEHEVELYGRDFDYSKRACLPEFGYAFPDSTILESYVEWVFWDIEGDWLDTSWFQPVEKLIDVDGIPIVWKISWQMMPGWWYRPFGNGAVEAVHVYWGE